MVLVVGSSLLLSDDEVVLVIIVILDGLGSLAVWWCWSEMMMGNERMSGGF